MAYENGRQINRYAAKERHKTKLRRKIRNGEMGWLGAFQLEPEKKLWKCGVPWGGHGKRYSRKASNRAVRRDLSRGGYKKKYYILDDLI